MKINGYQMKFMGYERFTMPKYQNNKMKTTT